METFTQGVERSKLMDKTRLLKKKKAYKKELEHNRCHNGTMVSLAFLLLVLLSVFQIAKPLCYY